MGIGQFYDAVRMKQIEDTTVVAGFVDLDGHLLLSRRDGATIDAGDVRAPNLADASTTVKGIAQLATDAEAVSGLDDLKIITPKSLAAKVASIPPVPSATDTIPGIVELATSAETIAGTDSTRAVTPSGLATLTSTASRRGLVELATDAEVLAMADSTRAVTPASLSQNTLIGKRRVTPSAVSKAGGGTVVVDADGTVRVTVAGVTAISLDGLFRPGKNYEIDIIHQTAAAANNTFRFRKAGTDQTSSTYVFQGIYGSGSWTGSYSAAAYGVVSTSALLTVNGQTFAHTTLRINNSDATSSMGWSFNSMTRSGSTSTFYIGNGDFAPTDCTGFTLIAGATTFSTPTTIKVWELL